MNSLGRKIAFFITPFAFSLQAEVDISNLNNCIEEVRDADVSAPSVPSFDPYRRDYQKLLADLEAASATLPYVYQQAAVQPLIQFLQNLGEDQYLQIFQQQANDEMTAVLQEMIPDVTLSILFNHGIYDQSVNAFQEVVSDLYDGFLSDEVRVGQQTGRPIEPPTYGVIPPLVKYGNPDYGPYTWPCDATNQVLGMYCGVVNLPPAEIQGGLLAWSALGHETGGHDVTHADAGLLDELAQKVYTAIKNKFNSKSLAKYWANCIDESAADVCGYLNFGPSAGIGLIGYFRALGDGSLRTIGSTTDPHPIDLLRGYLAAAVVKRLAFKDASVWSQVIFQETSKDNRTLYLVDDYGFYHRFPVSFQNAVASTEVVADVIMHAKLDSLQQHSLQELQNWRDEDQQIVDNLVSILKTDGTLPENLNTPDFYASYVIAAATQGALETGANITAIFNGMQNFLDIMHSKNPTWSITPTDEALALLEKGLKGADRNKGKVETHVVFSKLPQFDPSLAEQLDSKSEGEQSDSLLAEQAVE